MGLTTDLLDRILDLPPADRADLARRIILSLEEADFDADAEASWDAEIEARLSEVDRGEVKPLDSRESIKRIGDSLQRKSGQ